MPDQTIINPTVPTETANMAVRNIDDAIFRVVMEQARMVSARVTSISDDDKVRLDSYYAWMLRVIETATDSMSDFHYLATMPLSDIQAAGALIENPAIMAAMHHLIGANVNMRISPSGRGNDSLTPQDKTDLVDAVTKSKTYIDDFYSNDNPLDLNQSAPRQPVVMPMSMS